MGDGACSFFYVHRLRWHSVLRTLVYGLVAGSLWWGSGSSRGAPAASSLTEIRGLSTAEEPSSYQTALTALADGPIDASLLRQALLEGDQAVALACLVSWATREPEWFDEFAWEYGIALLQASGQSGAASRFIRDVRFRRLRLDVRAWLEGRQAVIEGASEKAAYTLRILRELVGNDPRAEDLAARLNLASKRPRERWLGTQRYQAILSAEQPLGAEVLVNLAALKVPLSPRDHRACAGRLENLPGSSPALRAAFWWHLSRANADSEAIDPALHHRALPRTPPESIQLCRTLLEAGRSELASRILHAAPFRQNPAWAQYAERFEVEQAIKSRAPDRAAALLADASALPEPDRVFWQLILEMSQREPGAPLPVERLNQLPVDALGTRELDTLLRLFLNVAPRLPAALEEVAANALSRRAQQPGLDAATVNQGTVWLLRAGREEATLNILQSALEQFPNDLEFLNNAVYLHLMLTPDTPLPGAWTTALEGAADTTPAIRSTLALVAFRQGDMTQAWALSQTATAATDPAGSLVAAAAASALGDVAEARRRLERIAPNALLRCERRWWEDQREALP